MLSKIVSIGRIPAKIGAQRVVNLHDNPAEMWLRCGRVAHAPPVLADESGRLLRCMIRSATRVCWESGSALTFVPQPRIIINRLPQFIELQFLIGPIRFEVNRGRQYRFRRLGQAGGA